MLTGGSSQAKPTDVICFQLPPEQVVHSGASAVRPRRGVFRLHLRQQHLPVRREPKVGQAVQVQQREQRLEGVRADVPGPLPSRDGGRPRLHLRHRGATTATSQPAARCCPAWSATTSTPASGPWPETSRYPWRWCQHPCWARRSSSSEAPSATTGTPRPSSPSTRASARPPTSPTCPSHAA